MINAAQLCFLRHRRTGTGLGQGLSNAGYLQQIIGDDNIATGALALDPGRDVDGGTEIIQLLACCNRDTGALMQAYFQDNAAVVTAPIEFTDA